MNYVRSYPSSSIVIVIAGLCAYLCIVLILHVPYLIYLTKLSQGILIEFPYPRAAVIGTLLQNVAIFISFAAIFWGIRRMRKAGKSIPYAFVAIIGIGTCILFFIINYYANNMVNQIYKGFIHTHIIQSLESKLLQNDLSLKNRVFIEKMLAEEIYLDQNRLISIADENGNHSLFKPTDDDIKLRRYRILLKDAFFHDEKTTRNRMALWPTILLLGICLGRFLPVRKANEQIA
jgi:hypothetical protein